MSFKQSLLALGAVLCTVAAAPVGAQTTVYRCESGGTVTYSEKTCAGRIVNTADAPVPARPNPDEVDARRAGENQATAQAMQPRAGESAAQFETRRRRARLMPEDRDECERLDARMPVEEASMNNPDPEEVLNAKEALGKSRKRFSELRC